MKKEEHDLLYNLTSSAKNRTALFKTIHVNEQGLILLKLSRKIQKAILEELSDLEIVNAVNYLDPDEVTYLLRNLSENRSKKIIKLMSKDLQKKVEFLLRFSPKTAAGLMSLDYIQVDKNDTFEKIAKIIEKHEKKTGKIPAPLVVEKGFLAGEIPSYSLITARKKEKITKYVKKVPHIKYDQSEKEVISVFKKHPHNKIVVLNDDESIMGVIYSNDVLRLIEKHAFKDLRNFAGVREEEDVMDSAWSKFKNRYKWLIINLATAFLAAFVVSLFEKTIAAFTLLAVYMPIVAGMGGNAGTQTLAVMVRGITLKEIELKTGGKVILNEMLAGAMNGVVNGILVAVVAVLWNKNPLLGLIIGVAMIINLITAGLFGAIVPLVMKSLGKDPASSATIFITTATDVLGFLVFLGLASLLL